MHRHVDRRHTRRRPFSASPVMSGTLTTASVTLLSNVSGLVRQLTFAWVFGTGQSMDAYIIASVVSQTVFSVVDTALSSTIIPLYAARRRSSPLAAETFLRAVVGLVVPVTSALTLLCIAVAPEIVHLLAPGFGPAEALASANMLRVMVPSIVFMGASSVAIGVLQSSGVFGPPAAVFIPQNILLAAAAALLARRYGVEVLAWAALVGGILQFIIVWWPVRRLRVSLRPEWAPRLSDVKTMLSRLPPVFATYFTLNAALVVDRILASRLGSGAISSLSYAQLLLSVPIGLIQSIPIALFPSLSALVAAGDMARVRESVTLSNKLLSYVTAPIAAFVILDANGLTSAVYGHGAFGAHGVALTADALTYFAIGVTTGVLTFGTSRAILSLGHTVPLYWSAVIAVTTTILCDLLLVGPMRQGGLALGTSLGGWAQTAYQVSYLRAHQAGPSLATLLRTVAVTYGVAIASIGVTGVGVRNVWPLLSGAGGPGEIASLAVVGVVGVGIYAAVLHLARWQEIPPQEWSSPNGAER